MKYLSPNCWNLQNDHQDEETDVFAEEGDLVFEIGGIFFLIQRENNFNNVVCKRIVSSKMTFQDVVVEFRDVMKECEIECIRVEGNNRRYGFLLKMLPKIFPNTQVGIVKSNESDEFRNIYYIKCY